MLCTYFFALALTQNPHGYVPREALSRPDVSVYVNNDRVTFDRVVPVNVGRRILVPLRGVFEKIGATVRYDPTQRMVTAKRNGKVITLDVDRLTARINGDGHMMDTYARIRMGHVLVPIRFVAEALDCEIAYVPPENIVRIHPL